MESHLSKSTLFTTNGKQRLKVVEQLQELLDSFSLDLLERLEKDLDSAAQWRVTIKLERVG